jgi:hypothetical protein
MTVTHLGFNVCIQWFQLVRRSLHIGGVKLDSQVPPVSMQRGVMCPFNSQAVLWSEEAFWMMLIPATTPMRVCDIWRGYFAQRLLWEIGGELLFGQEDLLQIRGRGGAGDVRVSERS